MRFDHSDSWLVLSRVERQIKAKIETIGMPLKDWNVRINYGIKTGFNEAFIISGDERKVLIERDPKSAEIIRPILRGRDIKRYEHQYADLHLIATFPSRHYDIEDYPAIKEHLLRFGYDRLKQTGEQGSRKRTNNQWFETQDSIGYWDDFSRPKIVWGNLNLRASYCLAEEGMFINAPCAMIVPGYKFLLGILNSRLGDWYGRSLGVTRNGGYFEYKPMFIERLPIPMITRDLESYRLGIDRLVGSIISPMIKKHQKRVLEQEIDNLVFNLYGLNEDEQAFVLSQ